MRISIFNIEKSLNYKEEYTKILKVLMSKCVTFDKKEYNYFEYVNKHLFHNWKFRKTYLDCYEYLEHIGVNIKSKKITKESFINFLEFLCNIQLLLEKLKYYSEKTRFSTKCRSILIHNIPLLLDNYGYAAYSLDDRIIIAEKDMAYSELMDILPTSIYELLISYKSIENNGIKIKRMILEKLYQYIENDIDKYKNFNTSIYNTIKLVITNMGIKGNIDKKYQDLSNYKLRKYYDNCYSMIVYLIYTENVLKYKEEIKNS